jgi:Cu2+-exporting ATPase
VQGGVDPAGKLAALRAAQQAGETVAMLGDGLNDAPVLAQADVSIAMGAGALLARTQADAVLLADRIEGVAQLHAMSQRCVRVVRQNMAWAAAYNLACVPLAVVGLLPPWAAGLGMAASSLVVVGNALRLAR